MKKLTKLGKVIVTIVEIILVVISYLAIRNNGSDLSELSIITFGLVMFTSPFILDLIWEDIIHEQNRISCSYGRSG